MTHSRRAFLTGAAALAAGSLGPRAAAAARPAITVYKEPT